MNEKKKKCGFAAMSPEEHKRIASMGGKRAQETGAAHRWTKEEASEAGKKGGSAKKQQRLPLPVDEPVEGDG